MFSLSYWLSFQWLKNSQPGGKHSNVTLTEDFKVCLNSFYGHFLYATLSFSSWYIFLPPPPFFFFCRAAHTHTHTQTHTYEHNYIISSAVHICVTSCVLRRGWGSNQFLLNHMGMRTQTLRTSVAMNGYSTHCPYLSLFFFPFFCSLFFVFCLLLCVCVVFCCCCCCFCILFFSFNPLGSRSPTVL